MTVQHGFANRLRSGRWSGRHPATMCPEQLRLAHRHRRNESWHAIRRRKLLAQVPRSRASVWTRTATRPLLDGSAFGEHGVGGRADEDREQFAVAQRAPRRSRALAVTSLAGRHPVPPRPSTLDPKASTLHFLHSGEGQHSSPRSSRKPLGSRAGPAFPALAARPCIRQRPVSGRPASNECQSHPTRKSRNAVTVPARRIQGEGARVTTTRRTSQPAESDGPVVRVEPHSYPPSRAELEEEINLPPRDYAGGSRAGGRDARHGPRGVADGNPARMRAPAVSSTRDGALGGPTPTRHR